jgi:L-seryl-tRNA(Ser) seleniumtransferase
VEIGDAVRTHRWELEGAINENTAAVLFVLQSEILDASLSFLETIDSAHAFGVPVIVDAAAELPPKNNLWRLVHQGADLVLFSGGKDIRGPQASGLIVGRNDLVQAAAYHSAPNHSIGRPMKASKEVCIGLLTALECYLDEDEQLRYDVWKKQQECFLQSLGEIEDLCVSSFEPFQLGIHPLHIPRVKICFTNQFPMSVKRFAESLKRGDPSILVDCHKDAIILNMHTLLENEIDIIINRIKSIITQAKSVQERNAR